MIFNAYQSAPERSSSFSVGEDRNNDQKSLMTLVAIASCLFDQQNTLEKKYRSGEQRQEDTKGGCNRQQQQSQRQKTVLSSCKGFKDQSKTELIHKTVAKKDDPKNTHEIHSKKKSIKKNNLLPQTGNFQCCTREGFLSKLFTVLNEESHSNILSWMPDGMAFTIISTREFSKSGLVYDLFGIRKMSSFLRRLNQLGFVRIRDPTDPNNLDVFRKVGFVAPTAAGTKTNRVVDENVADSSSNDSVQHRLESPTSTLQFQPTIETINKKSSKVILKSPSDLSSSLSSLTHASAKTSTRRDLSTSEGQKNARFGSSRSSSTIPSTISPWICSTPDPVQIFSSQGNNSDCSHSQRKDNTKSQIPPFMPICPSDGPVLLRARSESYERPQLQSMTLIKPSISPPTITNRLPLELSPNAVETLKLPNLR